MWRPPSLPMINEYASSSDLSIVMRSPCAGDAPCLAQETRKRKDLQLALHALACSSRCTFSAQQACCTSRDPLRDEIREVGRRLSLADTQTGRYGRLYSRRRLCARRGSRRTSAPPDPSLTSASNSRQRCVPKTYRDRYCANTVYVTVSRVNAYSGGVLARALPEALRYLSTSAWLSSDTPVMENS